jgi:hypothetical protein
MPESGEEIPTIEEVEEKESKFRTNIRLPKDILRLARTAARDDRRSFSQMLVVLIEIGLAERARRIEAHQPILPA